MLSQNGLLKKLDYTLIFAVVMIILMGLVVIYSTVKPSDALFAVAESGLNEVKRQIIWVVLGGIVSILMIMYLYYDDLMKHMKLLYAINLIMLVGVMFLGDSESGAQRWISLGSFRFQPSELSKLIIIICFAAFLSSRKKRLNSLRDLLPCFAFITVPALLILKQPDLGTALVFFAVMFGMLYAAGANPKLLAATSIGALGTVSFWIWAHTWLKVNRGLEIWIPLTEYQLDRLTMFLDPWKDPLGEGYNMIQSQIAIGQGGFWGRGLFQGSQTHGDFLLVQETDFIFSVVGEEMGFIGAMILLALFFIVIYRCILISVNAKDDFGTLIAAGVVSMITFHVFINVGMTSGIMPVTGIPLPMFSYGGSNMLTNLMALGLLQCINARRQKIIF